MSVNQNLRVVQGFVTFNVTLMVTHIWSTITRKESLWGKWIHAYKLDGRSFWHVLCTTDTSQEWRKLLQIRSTIHPFIWQIIHNGTTTSMWFDTWNDLCPFKRVLTNRTITRSGLALYDSVYDLIGNGTQRWPMEWITSYPELFKLTIPILHDDRDNELFWRDI